MPARYSHCSGGCSLRALPAALPHEGLALPNRLDVQATEAFAGLQVLQLATLNRKMRAQQARQQADLQPARQAEQPAAERQVLQPHLSRLVL